MTNANILAERHRTSKSQNRCQIHHKNGDVGGIGDGLLTHIHEIFEAPVLLGIAEVELDLEAQAVVIGDLFGGEVGIGAEQHDMTAFACFEMGLDADDDIEQIGMILPAPHAAPESR